MTRKEKILEKVRNNPKNVSFEDLDKLVRWAGFILRPQKSGTSHFVYTKPGCPASTHHTKEKSRERSVRQAGFTIYRRLR